MSLSPGTGAIRAIAASPLTPLPRVSRISTVSAWSSRVWAALSAAARSAADTLLLALDALLHGRGRFGIFAAHLGKRGAGHFLLIHRGQRLRQPEQRLRRLGMAGVFGGEV